MNKTVRVRFAPSPTGALHIGGVRTALYNYLLARQHQGQFIVRIEDTDQTRFVAGAEQYIMEALEWLGLQPDESPVVGGACSPYRQSDRKPLYRQYAEQLVKNGKAYYAFDTEEELKNLRAAEEAKGNKGFRYNAYAPYLFRNSVSLSAKETQELLAQNAPYVIRLRVAPDEIIAFDDLIRGHVQYNSNELDDKVLLKSDGMPTYHLANVVDDYLMQISHVIRGEEWLPSTPTHVLLYRGFGWQEAMPQFAHLPLILRPDGKGKLSKRDGAKFGIPVFPLDFVLPNVEGDDAFIKGFREWGFEPAAVLNFLALQGWSNNDNREFFTVDELINHFKIENINKAGTRFDFDKAKWFNQQYLMKYDNAVLAAKIRPFLPADLQTQYDDIYLAKVANALKERVYFLADYYNEGKYFFHLPDFTNQDLQAKLAKETNEGKKRDLANALKTNQDNIKKLTERYLDLKAAFAELIAAIGETAEFSETHLHDLVMEFIQRHQLKTKEILAFLRLALSGQMQGTSVFEMMAIFAKTETLRRLQNFANHLKREAKKTQGEVKRIQEKNGQKFLSEFTLSFKSGFDPEALFGIIIKIANYSVSKDRDIMLFLKDNYTQYPIIQLFLNSAFVAPVEGYDAAKKYIDTKYVDVGNLLYLYLQLPVSYEDLVIIAYSRWNPSRLSDNYPIFKLFRVIYDIFCGKLQREFCKCAETALQENPKKFWQVLANNCTKEFSVLKEFHNSTRLKWVKLFFRAAYTPEIFEKNLKIGRITSLIEKYNKLIL